MRLSDLEQRIESSFCKMETAIYRLRDELEDKIMFIDVDLPCAEDVITEASENFLVGASKTHANILRVLHTFLREINTKYTQYLASSDIKQIVDDLESYALVFAKSGAESSIKRQKAELTMLNANMIHDLEELTKEFDDDMDLAKADLADEKLEELSDKYADKFKELEDVYDDESKDLSVTKNTIKAVTDEVKNFTHGTKALTDDAVDAIDRIYDRIQSSENRHYVSFACKISNRISLMTQKITLYYVRYPFKIMSVLRKKIKNIDIDDK